MTVTPSGGNASMSVSVAPCALILTVPLAGSGSSGLIEIPPSVKVPVGVSFTRGWADTCIVLSKTKTSPMLKTLAEYSDTFFI
jgi:hypothetical protein